MAIPCIVQPPSTNCQGSQQQNQKEELWIKLERLLCELFLILRDLMSLTQSVLQSSSSQSTEQETTNNETLEEKPKVSLDSWLSMGNEFRVITDVLGSSQQKHQLLRVRQLPVNCSTGIYGNKSALTSIKLIRPAWLSKTD